MENQQGSPPSSSTKVERRIIEKNRRNHMKNLHSELNSLIPNNNPKGAMPLALPDQVDEAINYIKSLETKVKMLQQKKESFMERKRTRGECSSASEAQQSLKTPKIEIYETGSLLEVVLKFGVDNQFMFLEVLRILHEDNVEIMTANSSRAGDFMLHVVRGEVMQTSSQFGATKVSERLKSFVNGSMSDVEIEPEMWGLDFSEWGLLDLTPDKIPNPL
ncbi:hypothetical protein RJT34_28936 [Clitoria ternatea]|uniref:BHLH domain-containing protein n=1 Tax=Clitoria ternatea TaxID=43366 RepID=A0AAN9FDV6_CLITE